MILVNELFIGQGVGKQLIEHMKNMCRGKSIEQLYIISDPHAKGFYEKVGAIYEKEIPSKIEGRILPVYNLYI